ncbi:acetyltransferase [Proteus mirabilis]|uniref:acetyltransferase n=1 Tax=Proteus mirabilis TaxID=584 RepID=UPI000F5C1FBD|nr:acetyltransferase [Proteus mirabilis]MBS3826060.1 acetyltransferase [Proteus mirabilis]MBS3836532.1 acetyltransferase [Proteus mirabilis]RQW17247.1 acetyltransferase [Proteus mirabilis]
MLSMEKIKQPYWPALKLILSSLIVFSFYLKQSHTPDFSLLINIFDLTLIPMFVFIIGFITKNGTWKNWRDNLLAALVIYATFQTIDMIPLYYSGQFDLNTYLLFPQNGVWFFLATPIWQAFFLLLPSYIRHHKPILFSLLLVSILLSLLTKGYETKLSTFLAIIQYFPFFIIAYLVDQQTIAKLRSQSLVVIALISLLSIFILYYQSNINYIILTKLEGSLFFAKLIIYIISLLISFILSAGIIYLAPTTQKYASLANNALGVYLIHPIICFILLQGIIFFQLSFTLPMVFALTVITISLALLLASIKLIHWFISPTFNIR